MEKTNWLTVFSLKDLLTVGVLSYIRSLVNSRGRRGIEKIYVYMDNVGIRRDRETKTEIEG